MCSSSEEMDAVDDLLLSSPDEQSNSIILPSEEKVFSTKKQKLKGRSRCKTPGMDLAPPLPPQKSAPLISRVFFEVMERGPVPVSNEKKFVESPLYDRSLKKSYFEQLYTQSAKIGQGSYGEVFKAKYREDGNLYAVKKSHQKSLSHSRRSQLIKEVTKYEELEEHPNVVKFYYAWLEENRLYMTLELCKESLSQHAIRVDHIPEKRVWTMFADMLFAVRHFHSHRMVHMDIKPENIFISYTGVCKLGDLGLVFNSGEGAKDVEEGDGRYLAIEAFNGHPGKPSDIFSLGMTILEIATDLSVPQSGHLWQCLRRGRLPVELMKNLSETLQLTIQWMMLKKYWLRPTVNELLEHPELYPKWQEREGQLKFKQKIVVNKDLPPLRDLATETVKLRSEDDEAKEELNTSIATESRNTDEVDGFGLRCGSDVKLPRIIDRSLCVRTEPLRRTFNTMAPAGYFQSPYRQVKMARLEKGGDDSFEEARAVPGRGEFDSDVEDNASSKGSSPQARPFEADRMCNPRNLLDLFNQASAEPDEDDVLIGSLLPHKSSKHTPKKSSKKPATSTPSSTITAPLSPIMTTPPHQTAPSQENGDDTEVSMDFDDSWSHLSIESSPRSHSASKTSPSER